MRGPATKKAINLHEGRSRMTPDTSASTLALGQIGIRYLVDGSASGGVGLFELFVPPGSKVPLPHRHTLNDECIYVLEGVLRYAVDGTSRDLSPGEWMFSPRGSV